MTTPSQSFWVRRLRSVSKRGGRHRRRPLTTGATATNETALQACRELVEAYDYGEDCSGSVEWEDIDIAHATARAALGLSADAIRGAHESVSPQNEIAGSVQNLDRESTWVHKHSVNCLCCCRLVDERDCIPGLKGKGDICPNCIETATKIQTEDGYTLSKQADGSWSEGVLRFEMLSDLAVTFNVVEREEPSGNS